MTNTAAFLAALGTVQSDVAPVGLLGLEHEYQLRRDGECLDFRDLIHDLAVPGRRLDPGDTNAYRCASGLAVTCDDEEAEVASPPLPLAPHFAAGLDGWATTGRSLLTELLPPAVTLKGYSTHLSAAMPQWHLDRVVDLFAATFAPALMLVLDRASSHGVFVRPRPSRLELCGEFVIGERLRAAAAFFAGAARACASTLSDGDGPRPVLPRPLAVDAMVPLGRYGLEIDRHVALGFDFYGGGRRALLPLLEGGTISAQDYLEEAWGSARASLTPHVAPPDLGPVDRMVSGASPLGVEADADAEQGSMCEPLPPSPYGGIVARRDRGAFHVRAVLATWAFTVFGFQRAEETGYACVPSGYLQRFLDLLDAGRLDSVLSSYLQSPPTGQRLAAFAQTEEPGLWDEIGVPTDLLHPEPEPELVALAPKAGRAGGPPFAQSLPASADRREPERRAPSAAVESGPQQLLRPRYGKPLGKDLTPSGPPSFRRSQSASATSTGVPRALAASTGSRYGKPSSPRVGGPRVDDAGGESVPASGGRYGKPPGGVDTTGIGAWPMRAGARVAARGVHYGKPASPDATTRIVARPASAVGAPAAGTGETTASAGGGRFGKPVSAAGTSPRIVARPAGAAGGPPAASAAASGGRYGKPVSAAGTGEATAAASRAGRYGKPPIGIPPRDPPTRRVDVPPPVPSPPSPRWSRRTIVLIVMVLVALVGLGVAFALVLSASSDDPKPPPVPRTTTSVAPATTTVTSEVVTTAEPPSQAPTTARAAVPRTTVPATGRQVPIPTPTGARPQPTIAPTTPTTPVTSVPVPPTTLPPTTLPPTTLPPSTTRPPTILGP